MPQKVVAHASKSCGTCLKKLRHMPRKNGASATNLQGMSHNFSRHVPQLFMACFTTFWGVCHNFSGHVPQIFKTYAKGWEKLIVINIRLHILYFMFIECTGAFTLLNDYRIWLSLYFFFSAQFDIPYSIFLSRLLYLTLVNIK